MKNLLAITVTVSLAASCLAHTAATPPAAPHRRPRNFSGPAPDPIQDEIERLKREGAEAEARGDDATAEDLYRQVARLRPSAPFMRLPLARLYDRTSRERAAYAEYRAVVVGSPTSWSSEQEDPRILTRFGDLALRFGTVAEARAAYAYAARMCDRDDVWEPRATPMGDSLGAFRIAAHTSVAIRLRGFGDDAGELRELDAVLAEDGSYWVARFYRARAYKRLGRRQDATREAQRAEDDAPLGKGRDLVRKMRASSAL